MNTSIARKYLPLYLIALCWFASLCYAQQTLSQLPPAVCEMLDREYKGWRLAEVSPEVREHFARHKVVFAPNLLRGDFNGDGRADVALLITHKERCIVLAFLTKGQSVRKHIKANFPNGSDVPLYLWLFCKGEKAHNYETGRDFVYPRDTIGLMFYEKAGVAYLYERGKFRKVIVSD
jgi:hypothetical protein